MTELDAALNRLQSDLGGFLRDHPFKVIPKTDKSNSYTFYLSTRSDKQGQARGRLRRTLKSSSLQYYYEAQRDQWAPAEPAFTAYQVAVTEFSTFVDFAKAQGIDKSVDAGFFRSALKRKEVRKKFFACPRPTAAKLMLTAELSGCTFIVRKKGSKTGFLHLRPQQGQPKGEAEKLQKWLEQAVEGLAGTYALYGPTDYGHSTLKGTVVGKSAGSGDWQVWAQTRRQKNGTETVKSSCRIYPG